MLVLTRRKDEAIMLGDDIKITILDIDSDRIKIGIDAPRTTRILRAELKAEISNVNREATQTNLQFLKHLSQTNEKKAVEQSSGKQKPDDIKKPSAESDPAGEKTNEKMAAAQDTRITDEDKSAAAVEARPASAGHTINQDERSKNIEKNAPD